MNVLRKQCRAELVVLERLQVVDLELVMVAAGKLLDETLLVTIRAAARIEPGIGDKPCETRGGRTATFQCAAPRRASTYTVRARATRD